MYVSKIRMIIFCLLVTVFTYGNAAAAANDYQNSATYGRIIHQDLEREYHIYIPTSYNPHASIPLVIVCHGGGMTGKQMEEMTRFSRLAEQQGFIVVYPDAIEKGWNDDRIATMQRRALKANIDDVGFISTLIDHLSSQWNIDTHRVYIAGMSNGGMFSQRVARELTGKITAFVSVVAPMPETRSAIQNPIRPIPALFIFGAEDPVVHWDGGDMTWGKYSIGKSKPMSEMISYWVKQNGASDNPIIEYRPQRVDGNGYRHEVYSHETGGAPIELYIIENNGHQWPGGTYPLNEEYAGMLGKDFDATKIIWDFFRRFSR